MHRYQYLLFEEDADYVVFESLSPDGEYIEHTRWLVPGTWIEG